MPPIRIPPSKAQKTERTHEENQERAYIAASRRSDRSIEARVESARRASEIHKKRTGRGLRVTEQDVINEEMYEEEEDDMPSRYRQYLLNSSLQTNSPVFNDRLIAYLAANVEIRNQVANALTSANQMSNANQMHHIDPYGFNQSMYPSPMPGLQGFQGQQQQTIQQQTMQQQQQMIMQQQQQQMQRPMQQQMQQSNPYHRRAPYPPSRGMQHPHQHQRSSSTHIPAEHSASSNISSPAVITDRRMSMPVASTPSSSTPGPATMSRPSFSQGTFSQMNIQQHRQIPNVSNAQTPSLIGTPDIYPLTTQPPQNFNDFFTWNNTMMGGPVPNMGFQSSQTIDLKDQNIKLPQTSDSNGANIGLYSTLGSQHPHSSQQTPIFKFEDSITANGHDYFADEQAGSDVALNWDNFINDDSFVTEDPFAVLPSGSQ